MEKIIKAIIKTIIFIAIYFIIGVVLDFILNLFPYSAPVLLILAIIGMILTFYFNDKEE